MKRIISLTLTLALALGCCVGSAAAESGISPRASETINSYSASMKAGSKTGELRVSYNITATNTATKIGVESIVFYNSDGSYYDTVTGTEDNGLIRSPSIKNMDTYSYTDAVSGHYYYAIVTLISTIGDKSDTRQVTTATVKAP